MIRDRGNIKWTAMMLPEHVKMLRKWQEDDEKVEKPKLEDYELELISDEITRAHKSKSYIKLTYFRDGYLKNNTGEIIDINLTDKYLVLDNPFGTTKYKFEDIIAATIID